MYILLLFKKDVQILLHNWEFWIQTEIYISVQELLLKTKW